MTSPTTPPLQRQTLKSTCKQKPFIHQQNTPSPADLEKEYIRTKTIATKSTESVSYRGKGIRANTIASSSRKAISPMKSSIDRSTEAFLFGGCSWWHWTPMVGCRRWKVVDIPSPLAVASLRRLTSKFVQKFLILL
ncbi:hypothetical protein L6452_42912 [Arctium lappa]|uniref:Uncharacterized protein n=1 Tax=Arctium lappa TaxID=4217 RepID=A0ACB8XJT3_ARCLA|nr:hypothetical protein L6452_42912 [Arctium lappa]